MTAGISFSRSSMMTAVLGVNGLRPSAMRLICRGNDVPFRPLPDSSIEFYGRMNYGDLPHDDPYTDTNVYWLSWQQYRAI